MSQVDYRYGCDQQGDRIGIDGENSEQLQDFLGDRLPRRQRLLGDGSRETLLNVAEIHGLAKRRERIARRRKFVGHIPAKVRSGDAAHHAIPLYLLGAIEFVSPGNSPSMDE